jgi:hypothetical protein
MMRHHNCDALERPVGASVTNRMRQGPDVKLIACRGVWDGTL